ncbi:unnamed protein product [Mytilus edulis]|uniref:Uncharacterized protein n=1 Tax=Mytilus edulis TaxID=6550 RepID=A0A8S3TT95_MYTED|nr:unnamed protein product [Mytilus edulis]
MSGQANRNSSSNSYDSLLENSLPLDASVIITGYEKPWLDRSAICLDAGSDTDHEKIENNETAVQDQDNETRRSSFTSLKNDSVIENSMTIDKSIIITQYEKPWADRSAIDLEPDCYSEQCVVKTTESNTTPSDVQQAKPVEKVKNDQEVTHPFIGKDENHVDTDQEAAKQSIGPEARHTCIAQDAKRIDTDQEAAKQSNGPEARHTCIALDAKRIDTDQAMKLNIDQEAMKLNIDQEAIKLNTDQEQWSRSNETT